MSAIVEVISPANAVELLSVVWMEVTMASLAALVWLTVTGKWVAPKSQKKMEHVENKPAEQGKNSPRPTPPPFGGRAEQARVGYKALRQGKLPEAIAALQQWPETVAGNVPASVAPRLLMAVAKAPNFDEAMAELKVLAGKIESRSFEAAVLEAIKNKDMTACRKLQSLAAPMLISKSAPTLEALARAHATDLTMLRVLVDEAEAPLAKCFAGAVLEACAALRDVDLAMEVFEKVDEADATALRIIAEKASTVAGSSTNKPSKPIPRLDNSGKGHTKDSSTLAREICTCARNGNLDGALKIFERLGSQAASTLVYNAILQACTDCGDLEKSLHYFSLAESNGCVDVVSYNTMMKAYLAQGDEASAKHLLTKISEKGLTATHGSYHGLLNARANAQDRVGAWKLIEDMRAAGIPPNMGTCSILLKSKSSSAAEVSRALALIDNMEEPMNEVFFASVVEACVRTKSLDLLSELAAKFAQQSSTAALTASTYGAMIKAYGQAWDVKRVWGLWHEMTSNNVQCTAITLGCMVEALVLNYCVADAWQLVQKMWSEESTRLLVNTVIYSTILKGFANAKDIQKVMAVYEEMRAHGVQPNAITYNTVLNAFAQGGAMNRVPALLEDMKAASPPVEPDIVTYSTIVKGFCTSGCLDRALEILQEVNSSDKFAPDEVMYNSILDGCTREQRPDDALKILGDMRKSGVLPSNYTLSMLVKLMGRCRRLNQAFSLIEEISQEYGLKVNIQVYTCLIQACFNNRQANKAVTLHDQIIKQGLLPDDMTYRVLVKGCLDAGLVDTAVYLVKFAYGIGRPKGKDMPPGVDDQCLAELMSALGGPGSKDAKGLQAELGQCKTAAPRRGGPQFKGKGKGKGK